MSLSMCYCCSKFSWICYLFIRVGSCIPFLFSFSFLLICCQIWNLFSIIIGSSLNFMQVDNKYNKFPIFMKILTLLHYNFLLPLEFIFTIVNLNIWHWFFSRHISSLGTLFINLDECIVNFIIEPSFYFNLVGFRLNIGPLPIIFSYQMTRVSQVHMFINCIHSSMEFCNSWSIFPPSSKAC
jgi:hypothetical protein